MPAGVRRTTPLVTLFSGGFIADDVLVGASRPGSSVQDYSSQRQTTPDEAKLAKASEALLADTGSMSPVSMVSVDARFLLDMQAKIIDAIQHEMQQGRQQQMAREVELQEKLRTADERAHKHEMRLVRYQAVVSQLKSEAEGELAREELRRGKLLDSFNAAHSSGGKHPEENRALRVDIMQCEYAAAAVRRRLSDFQRLADSTAEAGPGGGDLTPFSQSRWLDMRSDKDIMCSPGSTATISPQQSHLSGNLFEEPIFPGCGLGDRGKHASDVTLGRCSPLPTMDYAAPGGSQTGPPSSGDDGVGPWNGSTGGVPSAPATAPGAVAIVGR